MHVLQIDSGRHVLIVEGTKRHINAAASLIPALYIRQPDFWRIELVECHGPQTLPALADYVLCMMLDNTIGNKGIEVVDCNGVRRVDIHPSMPGVE